MTRIPLSTLTVAAVFLSGCKPATLVSTGPHPIADAPTEGLRYYVPRDLIVVTAKVTTRKLRGWEALSEDGKVCTTSKETRRWLETTWDLGTTTAPDRSNVFRLGSTPSGRVEQTLKVTVSEDGLLTALNYGAKDQTAEIVANVLKGVAGIAGTIVGLPTAFAPLGDKRDDLAAVMTADRKIPLTDENCWSLASPDGLRLVNQRAQLARDLVEARSARATILKQSANARTEADAKRFQILDELQQRRLAFVESQLETVRTAITAGAAGYAASKGVGRSDTTATYLVRVDVAKVPATPKEVTLEAYKNLAQDDGLDLLADSARLAVFVDDLPPSKYAAAGKTEASSISCDDTKERDCTRIRFREPIPRIASVYAAQMDDQKSPLKWRESKTVNLVSSTDPVLNIAFRSNQLGQASTGLTFGRRGSVTGIEQSSNAALAGATSTIATALTTARQEFVAGLQTVQTTQTSLEAMRQANRTAQIKELQDQKVLIDAEVALQGASASRDLIAQKQAIDAQLALAQSQQALELSSLRSETSAEVSALRVEIERLQVQIELLKKQMELEKARREAAELSPKPPT